MRARPRLERAVDRDALALHVVAEQADHVLDQLVHVHGAPVDLLLAEQGAEPPDDLRGALRVVHDVGQGLDHSRAGRPARVQQAARRLRVRHDRGERLVDLVGERRGELAERRGPQHVRQLLALPLRLLLGLTPAGDVDVGHERAALRAPERLRRHLEPALAGGRVARVLELKRRAAGEHRAQGSQDPASLAIPRAGRISAHVEVAGADRHPDGIAAVLEGESAPGLVDGDDAPALVEGGHLTVRATRRWRCAGGRSRGAPAGRPGAG